MTGFTYVARVEGHDSSGEHATDVLGVYSTARNAFNAITAQMKRTHGANLDVIEDDWLRAYGKASEGHIDNCIAEMGVYEMEARLLQDDENGFDADKFGFVTRHELDEIEIIKK